MLPVGIAILITLLSITCAVVGVLCMITAACEVDDICFLADYRENYFGTKVPRTKEEKKKEFFWPFMYVTSINDSLKKHNITKTGRIIIMPIIVIFALPLTIFAFIVWLIILGSVLLFKLLFVREQEKEDKEESGINYKVKGKNVEETKTEVSNNVIDAEYIERN